MILFICFLLVNYLIDKDVRVFVDVLKENCILIYLDLSYNDIGEMGGIYLGVGLVRKSYYIILFLGFFRVGR